MNQVIKKVIVFLLPVIILGIMLELVTRNIPNDYKMKDNYMNSNSSKIETLILGSSHAFYGINPTYFKSNTYNLAFLSQSVAYDYLLWKHYHLSNLKTIILPISFFTLHSTIESDSCGWMIKNYNIYMHLNSKMAPKYNFEIFSEQLRPLLIKNYLYYMKDSSIIFSNELGWSKKTGFRNENKFDQLAIDAFHRHQVDTNLYVNFNIEILNKFIQEAKEKNIKVLLVTTPTYVSYNNLVLKTKQYKEIQNEISLLMKKYSNCIYINSINDKNYIKTDFYDGDHLNEIGARKYSVFLDSICNTIK